MLRSMPAAPTIDAFTALVTEPPAASETPTLLTILPLLTAVPVPAILPSLTTVPAPPEIGGHRRPVIEAKVALVTDPPDASVTPIPPPAIWPSLTTVPAPPEIFTPLLPEIEPAAALVTDPPGAR